MVHLENPRAKALGTVCKPSCGDSGSPRQSITLQQLPALGLIGATVLLAIQTGEENLVVT